MRIGRVVLVVSVVVLSVLLVALATVAKAPSAPAQAPEAAKAAAQSHLAVPPSSKAPGIYMAFANYDGADPAIYGHEGEFTVFNWEKLEPAAGSYNMGTIEAWVAYKALQGKRAAFGISSYSGRNDGGIKMPAYLKSNPNAVVDVGGGWLVPKYWSDTYLQAYDRLVQKIAFTFRGDPRIEFIAIGTGTHGEIMACDYWDAECKEGLAAAGLNSQVWVDAVEDMTDSWVTWFTGTGTELQTTLMQQVAPFTYSPTERRDISDYSAQQGVGLSVNGLYPQQGGASVTSGSMIGSGMYDGLLTWWEQVPVAFETYNYMLCDPQEMYWGMISGLDKHADYLRFQQDLFFEVNADGTKGADRTENLMIMDRFSPYLGATVEDTPSVWVAMRAPQHPWRACWGSNALDDWLEYGNYSFWLDQVDNIEGGKTVPETNAPENRFGETVEWIGTNSAAPYNPDLPAPDPAKPVWQYTFEDWMLKSYGWVIRRTDEATGNPYMWLQVDDGYINGEWNSVAVTVTYADIFTDTWSLEYEAIGGVLKAAKPQGSSQAFVQKMDSDSYKTVTFLIDDARLGNGLEGESDLRINCNNDGDDWIHFVELKLLSTQLEPTPTPTVTPRPTDTPTPTPTPTPTTGRIEGLVWEDQNQDSVRDLGEPGITEVTVSLKALPSMAIVATAVTQSDGSFEFSSVDPGNYMVEQTDLPGYTSTTVNLQGVSVFANEVQRVEFGDYLPPTPTPTVTPTATPVIMRYYLPLTVRP